MTDFPSVFLVCITHPFSGRLEWLRPYRSLGVAKGQATRKTTAWDGKPLAGYSATIYRLDPGADGPVLTEVPA